MRGPTNKYWLRYATMTLLIIVASFVNLLIPLKAGAAELTSRSIVVASSVSSALTNHRYNFRVNGAITIGSLEIEYCTNTPLIGAPCVAPAGFSLVSSSMGAQTGLTGFSIHPSTTTNRLILGRTPSGVVPPTTAAITVNSINNPSTPNQAVFVRISTFATNNATGIRGDNGSVVFATTRSLNVSGFVPPYLTFCVGNTVAADCSSATGNYLDFGELTNLTTRTVTSQFAAATNDNTGYVATVSGLTLISGNNIIPGLVTPTVSLPGTSQFGINLRANSSPVVGTDKTGVGTGVPAAAFNTPNNYAFQNGNIVSSPKSTDFNVFTVTYIANVAPNQPPGIYISTFTFIATVSF